MAKDYDNFDDEFFPISADDDADFGKIGKMDYGDSDELRRERDKIGPLGYFKNLMGTIPKAALKVFTANIDGSEELLMELKDVKDGLKEDAINIKRAASPANIKAFVKDLAPDIKRHASEVTKGFTNLAKTGVIGNINRGK